jgi:crossover junction endodeoxyribonuclease RuvC
LTPAPQRILGIDTSLRSTGFGVIEVSGSRMRAVEYGTLANPRTRPLSECLRHLYEGMEDIVARSSPIEAVLEGAFFHRNARTAMVLGQARGTVIAACAAAALPVYEYAPRRVKMALVGFGAADKDQVGAMVQRILGLAPGLQEDAADALAMAICHAHVRAGHAALMPAPI